MISWRKSANSNGEPAPRNAKRVLVIALGGVAEFTQALAAAKAIRHYHIGARITLLAGESMKALAEKCPYFDVVETESALGAGPGVPVIEGVPGTVTEPPKLVQVIARIRAAKYDMVYDLENSKRTAAIYSGLRPWPPRWSGAANGASHPLVANDRKTMHPLDAYSAQLNIAGVSNEELLPDLSWVRTALRNPPRQQPDYFGIRGRYVLMLPRADETVKDRRWPEAKYADIARRMASQDVTPVVLGGPAERTIGAAIAKAEPRAKNLVTRPDLFQCAGLAERAAFAFGDDVELMYVAAAAGAQCLVFLSSSASPERAAPRGPGGVVAFTAATVADIPVEQVERQLRNCGVLQARRATA